MAIHQHKFNSKWIFVCCFCNIRCKIVFVWIVVPGSKYFRWKLSTFICAKGPKIHMNLKSRLEQKEEKKTTNHRLKLKWTSHFICDWKSCMFDGFYLLNKFDSCDWPFYSYQMLKFRHDHIPRCNCLLFGLGNAKISYIHMKIKEKKQN